jgi:DNA-binding MarR family transcriptional regulator
MADLVDDLVAQWAQCRPQLDVSSLQVVGRLLRAGAELQARRERALRPHGLSPGDFDVLATLRRSGGELRPTELSHSCLITTGAMTTRLDRLESAGLVTRHPAADDRRSLVVHLTPRGRQILDAALEDVLAAHERYLAPLRDRDRARLIEGLRALSVPTGG